jgi:hypothetical protein
VGRWDDVQNEYQYSAIPYNHDTARFGVQMSVYNVLKMSYAEKIQLKIHRPHVEPKSKIHWPIW